MSKDPRKFLYDIIESIDFIFEEHLASIEDFEQFAANRTVQDAVERRLMTIGEALFKLRREGFTLSFSDQMINRRNTLAHQYDVVSPLAVWESVQNELSALRDEAQTQLDDWDE